MDIKIGSSTALRVTINGDESRVIEFDPLDAVFADQVQRIGSEWQAKITEFQGQVQGLEMEAKIALIRDLTEFARAQIDNAFGPGTAQIVFGNAHNLEMIGQFLDGVSDVIHQARAPQIEKYTKKSKTRTLK